MTLCSECDRCQRVAADEALSVVVDYAGSGRSFMIRPSSLRLCKGCEEGRFRVELQSMPEGLVAFDCEGQLLIDWSKYAGLDYDTDRNGGRKKRVWLVLEQFGVIIPIYRASEAEEAWMVFSGCGVVSTTTIGGFACLFARRGYALGFLRTFPERGNCIAKISSIEQLRQ